MSAASQLTSVLRRLVSMGSSHYGISSQPTAFAIKTLWSPLVECKRFAYYKPEVYMNPVYKPEEQDILFESGEVKKLAHVPVQPVKNDNNCSVFHDPLVNKVINHVMKGGQKVLARDLVYKAFENIKRIQIERYHSAPPEKKEVIELNPNTIFQKAIDNCKPVLHLTPIKRGGVKYQVPIPLTPDRSRFMAIKWLLEAARDKERTVHFPEKFAWELLDAYQNQGRVVKKKQDLHRQCEANRAYAHYRWS